ncbi:MAG TPA: histidine kinase [Mucilaginibacter sp.]|jgi:two-component system LytT family sensor kinase|nr:histidine kinase [Mucilaginibacter sp.]
MISIKKKDWIEILLHIAFWIGVYYTLSSLTSSTVKLQISRDGADVERIQVNSINRSSGFMLIFMGLLFYGNILWIFKKALRYKKMLTGIAAAIGWFIVTFSANYFLIASKLNTDLPLPPGPKLFSMRHKGGGAVTIVEHKTAFVATGNWMHAQLNILLLFLAIAMLSIAYFFLKEWARTELMRNQLEAVQLDTEVKFLKSQVNPHFLFNTLNNLFSMAQKKGNDDLADGISKLSGMMRYMIYESNEETVPLKKEIEYLENCILLNRLRYADNEVKVLFNYPEQTEGVFVVPMLFIPFVENAFKHGVIIGKSSEIDISISVINKQLIFNCENIIYGIKKMEDEKSGIGLENVKRRLELVYPGKCELSIKNADNKYIVNLEIILE